MIYCDTFLHTLEQIQLFQQINQIAVKINPGDRWPFSEVAWQAMLG